MFKNSDLIKPLDKERIKARSREWGQEFRSPRSSSPRESGDSVAHCPWRWWKMLDRSSGQREWWQRDIFSRSWVCPSDEANTGPERQNLPRNQGRAKQVGYCWWQNALWALEANLKLLCSVVLTKILTSSLLSALTVPTISLTLVTWLAFRV